jgi:hypothetical protein
VSWWVARAERTVSEEIPAPPNAVRDFYVDLDNIKRVHPLVVAVRATDRRQTADGYVQSYRVQDRFRWAQCIYGSAMWHVCTCRTQAT